MNNEEIKGHLVLVMAPSGSGKGVLIDQILNHEDIYFLRTFTSRARREGKTENPLYNFISKEEFEQKVANDDFVEWANFSGNLYGTDKHEILDALSKKQVAFKEMELQGIRQVRNIVPAEHLTVLYIDAGGWDALKTRILERASISDEELALRKERYEEESQVKDNADIIIENKNGQLEDAKAKFKEIICNLIAKTKQ